MGCGFPRGHRALAVLQVTAAACLLSCHNDLCERTSLLELLPISIITSYCPTSCSGRYPFWRPPMLSCKPDHQADSGSLLVDLHRAHEDVLGSMEELCRLTRDWLPDEQALGCARWKLGKAGMLRRRLWARILGHLAPTVDRDARDELLRLQKLDIDLLCASTEHIRRWTIESIVGDWQGYCAASRAMRSKMISRMEEEKRVLYPLLRAGCPRPHLSGSRVQEAIPRRTASGAAGSSTFKARASR